MRKRQRKLTKISTWIVALALILQMGFATTAFATEAGPDEDADAVTAQEEGEETTPADAEETEEEVATIESAGPEDLDDAVEEAIAEAVPGEAQDDESVETGKGIRADASEIPDEQESVNAPEVTFEVAYAQEEAGTMLEMVNALRTGSAALERSEDAGEEAAVFNLPELAYNEDLENIALQRAAETALYWSHTRPDGQDAWSAYAAYREEHEEFSFTVAGENIACTDGSAEDVFAAWIEGDQDADEGNSANLLSADFNAIGIACVYYNDTYFWVVELANVEQASAATESGPASAAAAGIGPAAGETSVTVKVADSNVTGSDLTADPDSYTMTTGETADVPVLSGVFATKETRPQGVVCAVTEIVTDWSAADTSIVNIEGGTLTAVAGGSTELTASLYGQEFALPVEVTQSIADCAFAFDPADGVYDGTAQEPELTVTSGDITLTPEDDYTVSYSDNVNAGTASVIVTGAGSYNGEVTLEYPIAQREVTPAISGTTTKEYDGTTEAPDDLVIELSDVIEGDDVSAEAEDYAYNSADADDATTITASGITLSGSAADNYILSSETAETDGTITKIKAELAFKEDFSLDKTYDGEPLEDATVEDLEETEVPEDEIEFEWFSGEPDSENVIPAPTDAGTYSLVARVAEGSDYEAEEAVLPVTIGKVDYAPSALEVTVTAGKAEKNVEVDIADLIQEGGGVGEPTVEGKDVDLIDGTPEATETEVTFDTTAQDDGATATILVPVTGCVNYNDYEITIEVTAVEPEPETEPGPETGGSGTPATETEPGPETGGSGTTATETEPGPETGGSGTTATETEPGAQTGGSGTPATETEPGPTTGVTDEPNPTTETEPGPDVEEPEPNPETETEPGPVTDEPIAENSLEITGKTSMTYDGRSPNVQIVAEYGANTAVYNWYNENGIKLTAAPTDAGTYSVEVTIGDTADYEGADAEETYVINPATPKVTLENKEALYTGEEIPMEEATVKLVNGETFSGTITYTYYEDKDCTEKLSGAPTEVGTYYVVASIPASKNYTEAESSIAELSILALPSEGGIDGDGTDGLGETTVSGGHTGVNVPVLILILAACAVAVVVIVLIYLRRREA